jgi:hypothetical protein
MDLRTSFDNKTMLARNVLYAPQRFARSESEDAMCIFFLTFNSNNLIYESRCGLQGSRYDGSQNFDVRENESMKHATKKAAKKAPAKKAAKKKK